MLAALILGAPTDPAQLVELLRAYGRARVADALLDGGGDADVIEITKRKSGPRRGQAR
jgi:hypothetical protein